MNSDAPAIVVRKHEWVWVVRDDLYPFGSKARFLDSFFGQLPSRTKEVVYSSPRWGFAQISIAYLCRKYGKAAVIFLAKAGSATEYTKRAGSLGAVVVDVSPGYMSVCHKRAVDYANEKGGRLLLPLGLAVDDIELEIAKVASQIQLRQKPDEVWTVAGSGCLTRGLQKAWPEAKFFAVQTGRELSQRDVGKATIIKHPLPFNRSTKALPPFPSVPEYDAKAWEFIPKDGRKFRLFWNVGGPSI